MRPSARQQLKVALPTPASSAPALAFLAAVADWIFQANPKKYDLLAAAVAGKDDRWSMKVHRQRVAVGDQVWFLIGGAHAGLYVLGTIVSPVYEVAEDDGFGKWKIDVTYDAYIDPPLLRAELLEVQELSVGRY